MANPIIRKKLVFYPEDSGRRLKEAWQGRRWLHELNDTLLTPMVRHETTRKDFYVGEPALLLDGTACMPCRWFTRNGELFGRSWPLEPHSESGRRGWTVRKDTVLNIPFSQFLLNYLDFRVSADRDYGLPRLDSIFGVFQDT